MSPSEALPNTALILCRSYHAEALRATASEGLAQGPYMAARVGFEPATLQTQGTKPYLLATTPHTVLLTWLLMMLCMPIALKPMVPKL